MKTRDEIYANEATDILNLVSTYHCIRLEQIKRLIPKRESQVENLTAYLLKQGRIFQAPGSADIFFDTAECKLDSEMLSAIWLLCDFSEKLEYHSVGTYPVKLTFFADGEVYDVVYVPQGKETLINCALTSRDADGKRFVIVEDISQIESIEVASLAAYCLVNRQSGEVRYYTLEG